MADNDILQRCIERVAQMQDGSHIRRWEQNGKWSGVLGQRGADMSKVRLGPGITDTGLDCRRIV